MKKQPVHEAEFIELIQQNERLIYKVCTVYAENTEDRKDLFQEIVLQVWKAYAGYKETAKITTWLYRIALNTAISHKRKQARTVIATRQDDALHNIAEAAGNTLSEEYKMLHNLIGKLPSLEKALILLYLEDRSYQEMAEILGLTATNVGVKLNRVKEKLRKQAEPLFK